MLEHTELPFYHPCWLLLPSPLTSILYSWLWYLERKSNGTGNAPMEENVDVPGIFRGRKTVQVTALGRSKAADEFLLLHYFGLDSAKHWDSCYVLRVQAPSRSEVHIHLPWWKGTIICCVSEVTPICPACLSRIDLCKRAYRRGRSPPASHSAVGDESGCHFLAVLTVLVQSILEGRTDCPISGVFGAGKIRAAAAMIAGLLVMTLPWRLWS